MVVGDPSQIKPVLTLDGSVLKMLGSHFGVDEKYLSENASAQTLVDSAGRYGFYYDDDRSEESWIGIPLWVHRRCAYPMFTISNKISYRDMMVQGNKSGFGKTGWFDVKGRADNKYVREQGDFLANKIYVDYLWTLWGLTRVPYDGDFMQEYADMRYIRLKKNIEAYQKLG